MKTMIKGLYFAAFAIMFVFALVTCKELEENPEQPQQPQPQQPQQPQLPTVISSVSITITAPMKGEVPDTTASGTGNFTVSEVTWSPADNTFLGNKRYTASVTLTANSGYTFAGLNSPTINEQRAIVSGNTGETVKLSYSFPATLTKIVTNIEIKTQPSKLSYKHGNTLDLAGLEVTLIYDDKTTEDVAAVNFTTKNLTANPSQNTILVYSTHNGQPVTITCGSLTCTTSNLTVSTVTNIEIKTQPTKLIYTHGNTLDLTGLVVTLFYNDTTTEDVALASFVTKKITAKPAQGVSLVHVTHNEQPVTITYDSLTCTTSNLTVTKATGIWVNTAAINTTYTPTLTLGDLTLPDGYAFNTPSTAINVDNGQSFAATYINPNGNYEAANGVITVNVAKSGPASWPTASSITYGLPLSSSVLSGGDTVAGSFKWTSGTTFPTVTNNGYSVTFTPFDTNNYTTTTRMVAITVNKAAGEVVGAPTLSLYGHNGILIKAITTGTGQSVEYGISTSNNANTTIWQTELAFTNLNTGTSYYIFARTVENANYNTGVASGSLQVTTKSSNVLTVTTSDEWRYALDCISSFGNGTTESPQTYTITVNGDVQVYGYSYFDSINVIVTLNGNGKLYGASSFWIRKNQTFIIDSVNLTLQGLKRGQNGSSKDNGGPLIECSGTLELRNGTISGNTASNASLYIGNNNGGGVYINGGIFNMSGGTISGNTALASGTSNNSYYFSYGGGVYVGGTNSVFKMTGGTISGNTASASGSAYSSDYCSYGGGVCVRGTNNVFIMTGGTISGNTVSISGSSSSSSYRSAGGGVYIDGISNIFNMTGGTISGNTASYGGGGVAAATTFNMTGGTITGNTAGYGGGVSAKTFIMESGIISGNKAKSSGGGVYFYDSLIKTGGIIYGNDVSSTDKNTVTNTTSYGHTVYYDVSPGFYRDVTLNENDNLYSTAPLPENSGQSLNGWTKR